ncbi:MAG: hypothetical protein QOF04_2593 [Solirubrobacteraceae bacterium]|jgi:hypothetical protein|nr:hypothetical protein [Solirubrobacteraceae bacterium]
MRSATRPDPRPFRAARRTGVPARWASHVWIVTVGVLQRPPPAGRGTLAEEGT